MKIVVLVIASHDTVYDQFATNWRSQVYPENVKVYFLYCSEEQDSLIEVRGDCIYLKGRECVKPGLHYKTLHGMQYILSEPFDYLIRTNLTSFINLRKLNTFLEDKPVKNCMAGTHVCGGFLSGSGYAMTRDIVQDYCTWCDEECTTNPMVHFDDEFVGEYIKEKSITCHDLGMVTYTPDIGLAEAAEKLHVRFKSSADRITDIEQHSMVIDIYNNTHNLVFYIAHYCSDTTSVTLLNYCVRSIQQFYPDSEIVICESKSSFTGREYDISGVTWIDSPLQNSSCVGCFKDFLTRYRGSKKKAVFMHDSMMLKGAFKEERISSPFGFIWHFSCYTEPRHLESDTLAKYLLSVLVAANMNYEDYVGCFGFALYGDYASIETLWKAIPFEEFIQTEERKKLMVDLERIVGAVAFQQGLLTSTEDCSLCGNIFDFPNAMSHYYVGQTYDDMMKYEYNESALKFWGKRFHKGCNQYSTPLFSSFMVNNSKDTLVLHIPKGCSNNENTLWRKEGRLVKEGPRSSLEGEIYFYKVIQGTCLQGICPAYYSESHTMDRSFLTLEFLNGVSVSSLFRNGLLTKDILGVVVDVIKTLHSTSIKNDNSITKDDIIMNYLGKLNERAQSHPNYRLERIEEVLEIINTHITRYINSSEFTISDVIHGDPWFDNMIYSYEDQSVKLLDMKGKVGTIFSLKGDKMVDYAKLYQSILGFDYALHADKYPPEYESKCRQWLTEHLSFSLEDPAFEAVTACCILKTFYYFSKTEPIESIYRSLGKLRLFSGIFNQ